MGMYQRHNGIDLKSLGLLWFPTEFHYVCQANQTGNRKTSPSVECFQDHDPSRCFIIMFHHDLVISHTRASQMLRHFLKIINQFMHFEHPKLRLPKKKTPMSISSSFGMM